jgi:H+-transporting ATPase
VLPSVALVATIVNTTFFQDKFGVSLTNQPGEPVLHNDYQLHMIVYLQVAIISQALIFVTRSHGFFFMERPSFALLGAFCIAQLVSSIIAAYANWGFTQIEAISAGWIGIVWVWVSISKTPCQGLSNAFFYRTLFGSSPSTLSNLL